MKAMLSIVKKLGWNDKPAVEVINSIDKMVSNQQALELDTVGECDDREETLLSIALWDKDKLSQPCMSLTTFHWLCGV